MLKSTILNSRETKHILEMLNRQYGYDIDRHELDFIFLKNKDDRLYVVSKNLGDIDFERLHIDNAGIYFGEIYKEEIRLSIEGAQIMGAKATKNIIDINHDQMISWVKGNDIEFEDCGPGFIIVRSKNPETNKHDVLGCGRYNSKEHKLMNYVSKSRRLVVVNE